MEFLGTSNQFHARDVVPICEDDVMILIALFLEFNFVLSCVAKESPGDHKWCLVENSRVIVALVITPWRLVLDSLQ
jgi:hypothetical protein